MLVFPLCNDPYPTASRAQSPGPGPTRPTLRTPPGPILYPQNPAVPAIIIIDHNAMEIPYAQNCIALGEVKKEKVLPLSGTYIFFLIRELQQNCGNKQLPQNVTSVKFYRQYFPYNYLPCFVQLLKILGKPRSYSL